MASLLHRHLTRRARSLATGPVSLNLVPLIDVLTSIVFFGLLTYSGARAVATLTAFDLAVAPAVGGVGSTGAVTPTMPSLTVRVDRAGISVIRSGGSTVQRFDGFSAETLRRLSHTLAEHGRGLADGGISVIPADDLSYDDLIRVLDEVRMAGQQRIALGIRPRA